MAHENILTTNFQIYGIFAALFTLCLPCNLYAYPKCLKCTQDDVQGYKVFEGYPVSIPKLESNLKSKLESKRECIQGDQGCTSGD